MTETWRKRGALEDALDDSIANSRTLRAQLRIFERTARNAMTAASSGVKRTMIKDHEVEYFDSATNQTASQLSAEDWRYLVDLHDEVKIAIGGTPTDAAIYAEMQDQLVPVREVDVADCSDIRI